MLVLSRKIGESITFYTDQGEIVVKLNAIKGGHSTIAIDAPRDIKVLRSELNLRVGDEAKQGGS